MGCNLAQFARFPYIGGNFQYPVSDRMGCNEALEMFLSKFKETFSILYRIEWVVTLAADPRAANLQVFQYPVSDRMGCNFDRYKYPVTSYKLSVSCIGSNGL